MGTSEDADARDYFSHMQKHMIPFAPTQEGDRELIDLAFSKKKADERKEWLRQFKVRCCEYSPNMLMYPFIAWNVLGPSLGRDPVFRVYQQGAYLILDG